MVSVVAMIASLLAPLKAIAHSWVTKLPVSRVRRPDDFHTYLTLSSSSRTPLLTLWTASWCPTCKTVQPLVQSLVESGVGEAEGGVGYATVEYDAPDIMAAGFGLTYMITSMPATMRATAWSLISGNACLQNWKNTT